MWKAVVANVFCYRILLFLLMLSSIIRSLFGQNKYSFINLCIAHTHTHTSIHKLLVCSYWFISEGCSLQLRWELKALHDDRCFLFWTFIQNTRQITHNQPAWRWNEIRYLGLCLTHVLYIRLCVVYTYKYIL